MSITTEVQAPVIHLIPGHSSLWEARGDTVCQATVSDERHGTGRWDVVTCHECIRRVPELARVRGITPAARE